MSRVHAAAANAAWLVRIGAFCFKTRNGLMPLVAIGLLLFTEPRPGTALDVAGITLAVLGQALRVAVIGYRYIVRGGRNRRPFATELVTDGFFAVSRNPLYVGNLLIVTGLVTIWNSPWAYALALPFAAFVYRAIVAAEEDYLYRRYGDAYLAYTRQTPRWWPRLKGVAAATRGLVFNWRRVVLKEYSSTAAWTATATLLLWLKARPPRAWPYLTALAIVAALWSGARYLKKSKRLHA